MIQALSNTSFTGLRALVRMAALVVGLAVTGCAATDDYSAAPAADGQKPAQDYKVGSGDRLRIIVHNQPDLTGEFQVDGTGTIAFPLVGSISANGLTVAGLEKRITDSLSPDYLKNPSVSVEVIQFRPFYIVGEVKNPGSYPYVDGMRVINGVALAGGFTYRAREDSFYIRRLSDGNETKQGARQDTPVWPGDVIIVRERYF